MINIQNIVEDRLNRLWQVYKNEKYCKFSPNSTLEVPNEGIIFIGLNPSLTAKEKNRLIEKNCIKCEFHKLIYDVNKEYKYFRKFFDIAEQTNSNWGHIDILYNRETNQKKIIEIFKNERGQSFLKEQCKITSDVMDHLIDENIPRIFVVCNSQARYLLGYHNETSNIGIGYNFVRYENLGTYTYKNNPFFFTSMLTGQRALDNGSYKRLIWQIKSSISVKSIKLSSFNSIIITP